MQKNLIVAFFFISLLAALFFTFISLGWLIMIAIFIAPLLIILHVTAGVLSFKALPGSAPLLLLSAICLIMLALLRYDFDDVGVYSGYSQLGFFLGINEEPYIEIGNVHHWTFLGLILVQLVMDFFLIRNFGWKNKKRNR